MPNVGDLKPSENLVVLVIGPPGCGKTSAIASFCSPEEKGYCFDIDKRIRGLLGSKRWLGDPCINSIDYDFYDAKKGYKAIDEKFVELSYKYDKMRSDFPYKNLWIESVGSLSRMFLVDSQTLKGLAPGNDFSKMSKTDLKGSRIRGQVAFATPDDYLYGSAAFHTLFYSHFSYFTKCNIFLSGWTTDKWVFQQDENGNDMIYADKIPRGKQLLATNKIASELPGYFDEIWEFDKKETGRASQPLEYTVTFRSEVAKTSIECLPNKVDITNKNFKKVLDDLLKGAK